MTMRQLHQAYQRRVQRHEFIQAWCIASEGLKRARAAEQRAVWSARIKLCKAVVNPHQRRRRAA